MPTFTVHPLESNGESSRQNRRAYLSPETIRLNKLVAGEWAILESTDETQSVVVQIWPRAGCEGIALSSTQLRALKCSNVELKPFKGSRGLLKELTLQEVFPVANGDAKPTPANPAASTNREVEWLKVALKEVLVSLRYIRKNTIVHLEPSRTFKIVDTSNLEDRMDDISLGNTFCEVDWRTNIQLGTKEEELKPLPSYVNLFKPTEVTLGGLDKEFEQIKSLLELPMLQPNLFKVFGLTPTRGILLHGPPGTGKTALARAIASSVSCSCIVVNGPELASAYHGESEERLRNIFTEARKRSPCIVVLDEVDALCPRRDGDGGEVEKRVVATLLTLLDGMVDEGRIFVIAATNRPNSIDPALRRPGRFDREIEIGIPDATGREAILNSMLDKMPHKITPKDLSSIAGKTHGYVGADLASLVRESASMAIQRCANGGEACMIMEDLVATLPTIRPSAMREVFIETTAVKWDDIGGQSEVKQKLRECVEWPLTHRDTFTRLGVEAPRGVLLYGPPGCSKTMTAKALATESGINFIAIKGPELLNKYVGESERGVREIFRKARAASPSIIFFDEIDALGTRGEDSHNGVLTSLLNEMDGIEELSGVTVVAATNRPDVLDAALMRPGRLDRILYVGAPDLATRKEIFSIRFKNMAIEPSVNVNELAEMTEGCSGAEVASICQDAALATMNEDLNAPFVKRVHLLESARTVRRRITPAMIRFFDEWRDQSGVRSA